MEADWEVEIAEEAAVIDGAWAGYLDLRTRPEELTEVVEVSQVPALRSALLRLNSPQSEIWTAKCDVWPIDAVDPDELCAVPEAAVTGIACYIDLLPVDVNAWTTLDTVTDWCRELCRGLHSVSLRQCRTDLVIRTAFYTPEECGLGVTAYISACGKTRSAAVGALSAALLVLSRLIAPAA